MQKIYLFLFGALLFQSLNAQIIMTEFMYNSPDGPDELEYIELYNNSMLEVNLQGHEIIGIEYTFDSVVLQPNSYIVIAKNDSIFNDVFGIQPYTDWGNGGLRNGGETIAMIDTASDDTLFVVDYDPAGEWPTQADGDGYALELCDLTANISDPTSWNIANTATGVNFGGSEIFGTPQQMNDADCRSMTNPFPMRTIAEMTTVDAEGLPDSIGVNCSLQGVIHGINRRDGEYDFTFIDDEGNGIALFSRSLDFDQYMPEEGDEVLIEGSITQFNGLIQINPVTIALQSSMNTLQSPIVTTTLNESIESQYVRLDSVRFLDPTAWEGNGNVFNMDVESVNGDTFTIRIPETSALASLQNPPVSGLFNVHGVVGQFDASSPYFEGYQLFPSYESDFEALSADVTVEVSSNVFTPADITINVGQSVEWVNIEGFHNVNGTQATFPDNPESFTSGAASNDNWTFTHTFNIPGFYNYQCDPHAGLGMVGTVTVVDPNAPTYPVRSIAEMTTNNADGEADSLGEDCTLTGIVHGINRQDDNYDFTIIDENGDGITVFAFDGDFATYTPTEGDELEIQGVISQFSGLIQFSPESINLVSSGNALLTPEMVTVLDESTESAYILMPEVSIVDPAEWLGNGSAFNVTIEVLETGEQWTMRIPETSDLATMTQPPVTGAFNLTGIGSQFDRSAPFDEGYQIFPNSMEDFEPSSVFNAVEDLDARVFPLPASTVLNVQFDQIRARQVQLINMDGKVVFSQESNEAQFAIPLSNVPQGQFLLLVESEGRHEGKMIIKQ